MEGRNILGGALATAVLLFAAGAHGQDAGALRDRQAQLRAQLAASPFGRPMVIESIETGDTLQGHVYAVVPRPFRLVAEALQGADHWCDILIVHLNVKHCAAQVSSAGSLLSVAIGRKWDQPAAQAYRVDFSYRVAASRSDYLSVLLEAAAGPLATRDYRIVFEAQPLDADTSFVHMSYSYSYGMAARLAMKGYLTTIGRNKVGFSVVGREPDGTPIYIANVRGMIERNAMRYYLAFEAYLAAAALPAAERSERRISDWFAATERYPQQLHELDRDTYLSMKRKEIAQR